MPLPEPSPRLNSTDHGLQQAYAPISWTAVAALILGGVFVLLLVLMGIAARSRGQSLIEPWLLVFPAFTLILTFIARRQIRVAEGTRTGETYANAAWWIAVLGGLGYVTYLGAIEFTIRREAEQNFSGWADHLTKLEPTNPADPNLYEAAFLTIPPGTRNGAVKSPRDVEGIERSFSTSVAKFRQLDLVRLCERNPNTVTITPQGMQNWTRKPTEITCTLTAKVTSPEGEHILAVPMQATIDDRGRREWQVLPNNDGFIKSMRLSPYGKEVAAIEASGQTFIQKFLIHQRSDSPYRELLMYLGFVEPGWTAEQAVARIELLDRSAPGRAAVGGGMAILSSAWPLPSQPILTLKNKVFAKPNGSLLNDADHARFLAAWLFPGRLVRGTSVLKTVGDSHPLLQVLSDSIEMSVPVELLINTAPSPSESPTAAKGFLVIRVSKESDPKLFAELDAAREQGTTQLEAVAQYSIRPKASIAWRVVRLVSDLALVTEAPPRGPGG